MGGGGGGGNLINMRAICAHFVRQRKSCGTLSRQGQMILKIKVNDPHFQYQTRVYQDPRWVQIWWFQPKSVRSYYTDNPNTLELWVKMAKMTLKVKVNDLKFRYQLRVSHDACLVQIWWFQLKSVRSCRADKLKFTSDGRTDGRMQRQCPIRHERPYYCCCYCYCCYYCYYYSTSSYQILLTIKWSQLWKDMHYFRTLVKKSRW